TTTPTAGTSFTATLSAHDLYDNVVSSYAGTKTVTWSALSTSPAPEIGRASCRERAEASVAGACANNLKATAYAGGANTLTATVSCHGGWAHTSLRGACSSDVCVTHLTTTPTAGTSFTATLSAHDLYDNVVSSYAGTKTVTWSALSTSPAPASQAPSYPTTSVSSEERRVGTNLTATAYAGGANTTTSTESGHAGPASLTVGVASFHHFHVSRAPTSPPAGTSFTATLSAHDLYDNVVSSYAGTKTVTWSALSTSPAPASQAPSYPTTSV